MRTFVHKPKRKKPRAASGVTLTARGLKNATSAGTMFRDLLENAPNAIVVVTQQGKIVFVNAQTERLFNYRREDLLDQSVETLIPERFREGQPEHRGNLFTDPRVRSMGAGAELHALRKDGSEFPMEISRSQLKTESGLLVCSAVRDVTERNEMQEELRRSEEKLQLLVAGVKDYALLMVDTEGRVTTWNEGAQRIKGYQADEIVGQHFSKFYTPEAVAEGQPSRQLKIAVERGRFQGEGWRVRKDGTRFFADVVITAIRDHAGELRGFAKLTRDITERMEAGEALFVEMERAHVTLNSISDGVICTNISGKITFLNLAAERMTGWFMADAVGRRMAEVLEILDGDTHNIIPNLSELAIEQDHTMSLHANCLLLRRDGVEIPIEDSISPIHDREGRVTGAVMTFRDVSAARTLTMETTHSAQHDFLTGLPNRMLLNDRVNQSIVLAARNMKKVAVLFLDLDGFKHINDSLGHSVGDKLLQSVAKRLVACVRASDTVSRQGGDEFVVLLSEMEHVEDAAISARRMLKAVAEPHSIGQQDLHVNTCIGVSVYPGDGLDAETLVKNADTAMYQAKENGRRSHQFFTPEMNVRAVARQSIEENLRRALERQEFAVHYQPKVSLKTGEITGAEALIRWTHPTRGLVSPGEFIPVAEDSGLILPIGNWVLREACRQARAWIDAGLPVASMAVNISAMEFRDEHFLGGVFSALRDTALDPRFLELELTESVLMKRAETTESILKALRQRGVQVAVDDFGTGYSSLSYLRKFQIDALKIDQSFVRQITTAPDETSIVTAIISMGRSLGLRVVAEGVEAQEELAFLRAHECDQAQGYYFSRPVAAKEFAQLLETGVAETVVR